MSKKTRFYDNDIPDAQVRRFLKWLRREISSFTGIDPDLIQIGAHLDHSPTGAIFADLMFKPYPNPKKVNWPAIKSFIRNLSKDVPNIHKTIDVDSEGYAVVMITVLPPDLDTLPNPKKPKKPKSVEFELSPLDEALADMGLTEDEFDKMLDEIENRKKYVPTGKEVLVNYAVTETKAGKVYTPIGKITSGEFRKLLFAGVPWERDYLLSKKDGDAIIYEFEDGRKFFFLTATLETKSIDAVDLMHWMEKAPKESKNPRKLTYAGITLPEEVMKYVQNVGTPDEQLQHMMFWP